MGTALQTGELTVQLHFGQDLKDCDWFGQQDPYVMLRCGNQRYRSNTHLSGGTNPVWNQVFVFKVRDETELHLEVWDQDDLKPDDCVGKATVSLENVRRAPSRMLDLKVPLRRPLTKRQQGHVLLGLSFLPDPAPGAAYCPSGLPYRADSVPLSASGWAAGRVSNSGISLHEECTSWQSAASGLPAVPHPAGCGGAAAGGSFRLEDLASFPAAAAAPASGREQFQAPHAAPAAPSYHSSGSSHYGTPGYAHGPQPHSAYPPPAPACSVGYPAVQPAMVAPAAPCAWPPAGPPQDPYGASALSYYPAPHGAYDAPPPAGYAVPQPGYSAYGAPAPYMLHG